jgi:hypothetical protein
MNQKTTTMHSTKEIQHPDIIKNHTTNHNMSHHFTTTHTSIITDPLMETHLPNINQHPVKLQLPDISHKIITD